VPCNRRWPGAGCDALEGEEPPACGARLERGLHRDPSSDFCVPLVALDTVVEIEGRRGRRELPLEVLHRLPGDTPERETALEPGDLIVALRLPAEAQGFAAHARYIKVRERTSYAFAVVSAAQPAHRGRQDPRRAACALGRRGSRAGARRPSELQPRLGGMRPAYREAAAADTTAKA